MIYRILSLSLPSECMVWYFLGKGYYYSYFGHFQCCISYKNPGHRQNTLKKQPLFVGVSSNKGLSLNW